jgi:hypothetical protein
MATVAPPDTAAPASSKTRDIDIPADLVPHFEAAVRQRDISVAVTFNDDGSRTYHADPDEWDEAAVIAAAEEGVERLRVQLANR